MAKRENQTSSTESGEWDVEKRVYDALTSGGIVHRREMELCRELAALAASMYRRRTLSDADIDEMLHTASQD